MRRALPRCIVILSIVGFGLFYWRAIRLYPGGTVFDAFARGHDFWLNFLCDLTHATAPDGELNPGAGLARASMLVLSVGLGAFFWLVPGQLRMQRGEGLLARWLGIAALPGIWVATLAPPGVMGDHLHGIAVLSGVIPGLTATMLAVRASFRVRRNRPIIGWAGVATFMATLFDSVLYTLVLAGAVRGPKVLPAAQKLALLVLIVWMLSVAVARTDEGSPTAISR